MLGPVIDKEAVEKCAQETKRMKIQKRTYETTVQGRANHSFHQIMRAIFQLVFFLLSLYVCLPPINEAAVPNLIKFPDRPFFSPDETASETFFLAVHLAV
ncbi:hypothetical protein CDAR_13221 [Caerostris darwini]|uniref:Uncharacterized protein n=1 Tax=Caerostris darwini TaxID=1538125 RepID=A0AAV4R402_9ARAC|nr:hypothetical protein CDAR_13221 [Caerostris darwini]